MLEFSIITDKENTLSFDCGVESLNKYLKEYALINQSRKLNVTIVAKDNHSQIVGYYTLCPAQIEAELLPKKIARGLPKYPVPALRLCRLAVDIKFQKKNFGKELLINSLRKCYQLSLEIGGFCIIVDAIDEKAKIFYEHFGFESINDSLCLFMPMKAIEPYMV